MRAGRELKSLQFPASRSFGRTGAQTSE